MASKAFAFMAGALVVLAVPAVFVSMKDRSSWESDADPRDGEPVLPEFDDLAPERLAAIELDDRDGTVRLEQRDGTWVLPHKGGYPADLAKVTELVRDLQSLRIGETSTSSPERHARVGLIAPSDGGETAVHVRVLGPSDAVIAELLLGRTDTSRSQNALFVRRPDDDQCYLALGDVRRETSASSWYDAKVLAIPTSDVARAAIEFAGDPDAGYELVRADPEDFGFVFAPRAEGREMGAEWKWTALARNAANLSATDVRPAEDFDASGAERASIALATYDGLVVEGELVRLPSEVEDTPGPSWIRYTVRAQARDGNADDTVSEEVQARAAELRSQLEGWWFAVAPGTAASLWTPREGMYAPLPEPSPEPPPGVPAGPPLPGPDETSNDDGAAEASEAEEGASGGDGPVGEPAPAGGSAGQEG